jgi:hypothetical protein
MIGCIIALYAQRQVYDKFRRIPRQVEHLVDVVFTTGKVPIVLVNQFVCFPDLVPDRAECTNVPSGPRVSRPARLYKKAPLDFEIYRGVFDGDSFRRLHCMQGQLTGFMPLTLQPNWCPIATMCLTMISKIIVRIHTLKKPG